MKCKKCNGLGWYWGADGPDDCVEIICDCPAGEILNEELEEEYYRQHHTSPDLIDEAEYKHLDR